METGLYLVACHGGASLELDGPFATEHARLARARTRYNEEDTCVQALDVAAGRATLAYWTNAQIDAEEDGMPSADECAPTARAELPLCAREVTVTVRAEGRYPDAYAAVRGLREDELEEEVVRVHGDAEFSRLTADGREGIEDDPEVVRALQEGY